MAKGTGLVDRHLFDTSSLIDHRRAPRWTHAEWAQTILRRLAAYRAHDPLRTISAFTVFELLDGFYRDGRPDAAREFGVQLSTDFDVIYPDEAIVTLGAEIHAALAKGQTIGVVGSMITATAISHRLTLVTSNVGHFARVQAAGFPFSLENWRES